jgi:hypothetical protein
MWNYRIIQSSDQLYGLYETIYNDDGEISAHAEEPEAIGSSVKDLLDTLRLMLDDAQKSSYNILEMDKIKFASLIDENEKEEAIEIEDFTKLMGLDPNKYKNNDSDRGLK